MEEAPRNVKELSHFAQANGMNVYRKEALEQKGLSVCA
jgi:hypothetical protein